MIDRSDLYGYADLAFFGHVSRARITQIMNPLDLAPDVQETLLLSNPVAGTVRERHLRTLVSFPNWRDQHQWWTKVPTKVPPNHHKHSRSSKGP